MEDSSFFDKKYRIFLNENNGFQSLSYLIDLNVGQIFIQATFMKSVINKKQLIFAP